MNVEDAIRVTCLDTENTSLVGGVETDTVCTALFPAP